MLYPIPLSTGAQLALGIAINLLAIVLLWGPFFYLRRRYKNKSHIPFRARLITFFVFAVFFVAFWWGYFELLRLPAPGELGVTLRDHVNEWTFFVDIFSLLSIPVYIYSFIYQYKGRYVYLLRLLVLTFGVWISLYLHLLIFVKMGFRIF